MHAKSLIARDKKVTSKISKKTEKDFMGGLIHLKFKRSFDFGCTFNQNRYFIIKYFYKTTLNTVAGCMVLLIA